MKLWQIDPDREGGGVSIEAGALVSFAHRASTVVGYVDRVESLGNGHAVAICMGLLVHPGGDTGFPQAAMRWRVPVADCTALAPRLT